MTLQVVEDAWSDVVGQPEATATLRSWVADPVHAFLFVGPAGSGKRQSARTFAGAIEAAEIDGPEGERHLRLAIEDKHPDVELFVSEGRQLDVETARSLIPTVFKRPLEGRRRIVIVDRFHAATPAAAASLLKTVEEPPPSAIIILLAEAVLPEHIAIASRCAVVDFPALSTEVIMGWLADQGADAGEAEQLATAAGGDIDRVRLLLADNGFAARADAWMQLPERLDGSGSVAGREAERLRGLIDGSQEPLQQRQAEELEALAEREEALGTRGSGRRELEARHKREIRKLRDDELRFGLAVLTRRYRDELVAGAGLRHMEAIDRLRDANEALMRNPNEALLLQNLFWQLPRL